MVQIVAKGRLLMLDPNLIHSYECGMFADASGFAAGGFVKSFWYQHYFTPEQKKLWEAHHKEAYA